MAIAYPPQNRFSTGLASSGRFCPRTRRRLPSRSRWKERQGPTSQLLVQGSQDRRHPTQHLARVAFHRPHGPAHLTQGLSTHSLLRPAQPHPIPGHPRAVGDLAAEFPCQRSARLPRASAPPLCPTLSEHVWPGSLALPSLWDADGVGVALSSEIWHFETGTTLPG
jgi:hypothetical protein